MNSVRFTVVSLIGMALASSVALLPVTASASVCVNISRDLSIGARGSDVRALQSFLASKNYPGGGSWMITGTFGRATQAAVRIFQQEQGIPVTGWVNGATRLAFDRACRGEVSVSIAPTPSPVFPIISNPVPVPAPFTYAQPVPTSQSSYCGYSGTYFGTTYGLIGCEIKTPVISSITPTAGGIDQSVTIYGSGFTTNGNSVRFGTGVIAGLNSPDGQSLSFVVPATLTGYGSQSLYLGQYDIAVTNSYGITSNSVPFALTSLAHGYGNSNLNVTGPVSIGINAVGTWIVTVNNQSGTYLSISADWGDQNNYFNNYSPSISQNAVLQGPQTLTFTHGYQQAGTYTLSFRATNNAGYSSVISATVSVNGSGSTQSGPISITSMSPMQGTVGTQIQISGTGITSYDNTVHFGAGGTQHVVSTNGGIYFTVPYAVSPCDLVSSGCTSPSAQVVTGSYPVYITNSNGSSNTLFFQVQ